MLTGAERNSLALTLAFVLLGSGIKLWKTSGVEIGPFPAPGTEDVRAGIAGFADSAQGTVPAPADSAGGPEAADAANAAESADAGEASDASGQASLAGPARGPERAGQGRVGGMPRETAPRRKAPPAGKVDPNRATADELATVPGIGPKTAAAIVAYRREHGAFRDLAQLREVKGIGEKKWVAIAPCLTIASARGGTMGDTAGTGPETDGGRGIGGR